MIVMLSNNTGTIAREMLARWPERTGHLLSPGGWRRPFPHYALDNGCFAGKHWNPRNFIEFLWKAKQHTAAPRWVAVPDKVMDHETTRRVWDEWAPFIRENVPFPLAFVVQNGCRANEVPKDADVIFVGGCTKWKRRTIRYWCEHFPRIHVGRINTATWLWHCHDCGAESCDGTGWFRGDRIQLAGLWDYMLDKRSEWNSGQMALQFE